MVKLSICDGAYTIVLREDGTMSHILRHGKYWPVEYYSDDILELGKQIDEICTQYAYLLDKVSRLNPSYMP